MIVPPILFSCPGNVNVTLPAACVFAPTLVKLPPVADRFRSASSNPLLTTSPVIDRSRPAWTEAPAPLSSAAFTVTSPPPTTLPVLVNQPWLASVSEPSLCNVPLLLNEFRPVSTALSAPICNVPELVIAFAVIDSVLPACKAPPVASNTAERISADNSRVAASSPPAFVTVPPPVTVSARSALAGVAPVTSPARIMPPLLFNPPTLSVTPFAPSTVPVLVSAPPAVTDVVLPFINPLLTTLPVDVSVSAFVDANCPFASLTMPPAVTDNGPALSTDAPAELVNVPAPALKVVAPLTSARPCVLIHCVAVTSSAPPMIIAPVSMRAPLSFAS